jgi:hypothetical protein
VRVRYRALAKITAQLHALFALANFWLVRRKLLACDGMSVSAARRYAISAVNSAPKAAER